MAVDLNNLPGFNDLAVQEGLGLRSAWGVFGPHDELGTWNLITPEKTAEGASMVKKGHVFALNAPIDEMARPLFWFRSAPRVTMFDCSFGMRISYDEYIDNFCPQSSSQWDGHRHVCHPAAGFYNGITHEQVLAPGAMELGIQNLAKKGVATRGVLLDIGRFLENEGTPLDLNSSQTIDAATLEACRRAQNVEIRPGDVLLFRLGWLQWFREQSAQIQAQLAEHLVAPGLLAGEEMAAYLWDLHIAAVATDVIAVEAWPPVITPDRGFFHIQLITAFGMNLGEMWELEALAEDCASDGVYEFMLTSAPLHIRGGVGSPPNALAIK